MADRIRSKFLGLAAGVVALAVIGVARADEPPPATASSDELGSMSEARKQFQVGVNLLDDPDGARYEEAYLAFHKAYALSKSPRVLGNIGFCSMKLERDGEAIDAYTAYLRESRDVDPRERAQIERDLATLGTTVATLRVSVRKPAAAFVLVDTRLQSRGSPVVNTYPFQGTSTALRVRPGRHALKVTSSDGESVPYEVNVEPGAQITHEFTWAAPVRATATPDAARPGPSYTAPVLVGLLGAAALGTGAVTGLMARAKADELDERCPGSICPRSYDLAATRSDAKTLGTVADASLIGGGVLLGGAIVWAIAIPGRPKAPRTGLLRLPSAACGARGCTAQIGGEF